MASRVLTHTRILAALASLLVAAAPAHAQWTQSTGLTGGAFNPIVAVDGGVLGSVSGGPLFRFDSTAWSVAAPTLDSPHRIGPDVYATVASGRVRSRDGGLTFAAAPALPTGAMLVSTDATGRLFATRDSAVLVSSDAGATWTRHAARSRARFTFGTQTSSFPAPLQEVRAAYLDGDTLYAVGKVYVFGDVYRLAPGDTAWTPTLVRATALEGARTLDIAEAGDRLVALATGAQGVGSAFVSSDGGRTWQPRSDGLPALDAGIHATLIAGAQAVFVQIGSAFYRLDGDAWTRVPDPPTPSVYYASASDRLYVSDASSVYRLDRETWTTLPRPIATSPTLLHARGPEAVVLTPDGLRRTADGGVTFAPFGPAGLGGVAFVPGTPLVFGAAGAEPLRSPDGGATWTPTGRPPAPLWLGRLTPGSPVVLGDAVYAGFGTSWCVEHCSGSGEMEWGGVYRTTDGGATWTDAGAGLPMGPNHPARVRSLVSDGTRLFATTSRGCVRSDGGAWTAAACPGESAFAQILAGADRWVAIANGSVFASTDGGATWSLAASGLPLDGQGRLVGLSTLVATPAPVLVADAGGTTRAYRFDGTAWQALPLAFPPDVRFSMFMAGEGRLYGSSVGRGLWSVPLSALTSADAPADGDTGLALTAPAPNPTRTDATLTLTAPSGTDVRVEVFDVLGRRVAVLYDGPADDLHTLTLDTSALPAGVYLVRATAGADSATRRLTVVR